MAGNQLDQLANDLIGLAVSVSDKNKARKLLKTEGNKLKVETVQEAKRKVKKKTGNLFKKAIKRGKPYTYNLTNDESVRVYGIYHAHLLNIGHNIVDKKGNYRGWKEGEHFFESAEDKFMPKFVSDVEEFVDQIINENNL